MEPDLLLAIKHSPQFFLLALMVGTPTFIVSVVSVVAALRKSKSSRVLGVVSLAGATLTVLVGVAGWLYGRSHADVAAGIPALTESEKTMLIAAGYAEALYNLWFVAAVAAPSILLGATAILLSRRSD